MTEISFFKHHKTLSRVLAGVLCIVVLYTFATVLMQLRLKNLREQIVLEISKQQTLLVSVAETTARNGADVVTESIIRDCSVPERTEFDDLLGRLDKGLSGTELTKLENLFGRCGSFYAQRKALMLSRLGREVEVYITLVEQLKTLTSSSAFETYKVDGWKQLVEQEKVQSELFSSLVVQQDAIISTLISNKRSDSEEMKAILQEVRETQESLLTANREAASTRATLIPL
jgi:hypothetical protein